MDQSEMLANPQLWPRSILMPSNPVVFRAPLWIMFQRCYPCRFVSCVRVPVSKTFAVRVGSCRLSHLCHARRDLVSCHACVFRSEIEHVCMPIVSRCHAWLVSCVSLAMRLQAMRFGPIYSCVAGRFVYAWKSWMSAVRLCFCKSFDFDVEAWNEPTPHDGGFPLKYFLTQGVHPPITGVYLVLCRETSATTKSRKITKVMN
jgi:hypothetical protein